MNNINIAILLSLLLISCSSSDEPEVTNEEEMFSFEGKWIGRWSDSLFPSLAVSAEVFRSGTDRYSGSFYYNTMGNAVYTPCCGGQDDDGKITFETDGDNVLNFKYVQNAPDYMGGCPGLYEGSGAINASQKLEIFFTGEDCDGLHEDGKITWTFDK